MPSLTTLTAAELLTQAIQYVSDTLEDCGYEVCATKRTHTEPPKVQCCDCAANPGAYTIYGWVVRSYDADGRLNPASHLDCRTFDATQIGFTVARCWPEETTVPKTGGKQDDAAAELALVLDCLRSAFGKCEQNPALFHLVPTDEDPDPPYQPCTRMLVGEFVAEKDESVTPYGDGKVSSTCAGWRWTITIA